MAQESHLVSLGRQNIDLNSQSPLLTQCNCLLNSTAYVELWLTISLLTGWQINNNRSRKKKPLNSEELTGILLKLARPCIIHAQRMGVRSSAHSAMGNSASEALIICSH